jgi:hypothetical protein
MALVVGWVGQWKPASPKAASQSGFAISGAGEKRRVLALLGIHDAISLSNTRFGEKSQGTDRFAVVCYVRKQSSDLMSTYFLYSNI